MCVSVCVWVGGCVCVRECVCTCVRECVSVCVTVTVRTTFVVFVENEHGHVAVTQGLGPHLESTHWVRTHHAGPTLSGRRTCGDGHVPDGGIVDNLDRLHPEGVLW